MPNKKLVALMAVCLALNSVKGETIQRSYDHTAELKERKTIVEAECKKIIARAERDHTGFTSHERDRFAALERENADLDNTIETTRRLQSAPSPSAAIPAKDLNRYSITRAISRMADRKPLEGIEAEVNAEVARASGRSTSGAFVPHAVLASKHISRALDTSAASKLVTQQWGEPIDVLRNRSIIAQCGARVMNDLVGLFNLPLKNSAATAAWIATDGGAAGNTAPNYTVARQMTPRNVAGYVDCTRSMLKESSYAIENLIADDLAASIGAAIDTAAINGTGLAGQPFGLLNASQLTLTDVVTTGGTTVTSATGGFLTAMVNQQIVIDGDSSYTITARGSSTSITVDRDTGTATGQTARVSAVPAIVNGANGLALTWAQILAFESTVGIASGDGAGSRLAYLANSQTRAKLKNTFKTGSTSSWLMREDGTVNGYPCAISQAVPFAGTKGTSAGVCSTMIYGDFQSLAIGLWGAVELVIDPYSQSTTGTVRVVALQSTDIAIRQYPSFCVSSDILTT